MANRRRVVVVDDNSEVRTAVRALLESRGFDVVADTPDASQAVALVASTNPDVVLLDWMFQGTPRGAVALAALRRWAPEVPVVVYTAYPETATDDAVGLGAAYVATKDIAQSADLAMVLDEVIEGSSARSASEHPSKADPTRDRGRIEALARRERARARLSSLPGNPDE